MGNGDSKEEDMAVQGDPGLKRSLSIWAAVIDKPPISVDTPADLERARDAARAETE